MGCQLDEAYGLRLIQGLFNKIETGTISGLQKHSNIQYIYLIYDQSNTRWETAI